MTVEEYYAAVRALGLTPSNRPEIFINREGGTQGVPDPQDFTAEQRLDVFERIRQAVEG